MKTQDPDRRDLQMEGPTKLGRIEADKGSSLQLNLCPGSLMEHHATVAGPHIILELEGSTD